MKKSFVFILAVLLVVAFTLPASAFESIFGGYWRTRIYTEQGFTGDEPASSLTNFDTRTRLYYTAKFSDNFSFVNRFEFDARWGDDGGYGDFGTDGKVFEIKHSYADFRMGSIRSTIGAQGTAVGRGFVIDSDFAGAIIRYQPGTTADLLIPFAWLTHKNQKDNGGDVAYLALYPYFPVGGMSFNPYLVYGWANGSNTDAGGDFAPFWLGIDFDIKSDKFSLWASGIYSGGSGQVASPVDPLLEAADNKGYLLAAGIDFSFGAAGLWVDFMYATGDDGTDAANNDAFNKTPGTSYYWSEILGMGIFDNDSVSGSPKDVISNLLAVGVGLDLKTGDKLKWNFDLWYAALNEPDPITLQDDLGIELDIILNYNLMENLNLDLVFAYLAAGDAVSTSTPGKNQEDPIEVGARLSFSF